MRPSRNIPTFRLALRGAAGFLMLVCVSIASQPVGQAATARSAIDLQGLHAYADRESVLSGETIRFHVSSQVPYRFGVSRLGLRVNDRASDATILPPKKVFPARVQQIHPGSYVRVKNGLPADAELTALALECWVRPWKLSPWQGFLTQHDYPDRCGFGLFYVVGSIRQDHFCVYAVRPGKGRLRDDQIVWENSKGIPHVPSPLLVGKQLFVVHDGGVASCLDALTGNEHWRERLGGNHDASPVEIRGQIYFCNREGKITVVAASDQFEVLALNRLEGTFKASPAVSDGALFLRSDTHLYRIESSKR